MRVTSWEVFNIEYSIESGLFSKDLPLNKLSMATLADIVASCLVIRNVKTLIIGFNFCLESEISNLKTGVFPDFFQITILILKI